jgi:hypothetical protein
VARNVGLVLALCLALDAATASQAAGVLHIRIALPGADGRVTPVVRYALLISDNPASAAPRRVVTGGDGSVVVRLAPGNYTVESDRPLAFAGREYSWTQTLDVPAGETTLELTAANADAGPGAGGAPPAPNRPADPLDVLLRWQTSVAGVWTPTTHATATVVDAGGLLVTNQQVVRDAGEVEVQLTPTRKVRARVVAADRAADVAVLRVHPAVLEAHPPVPLGCAAGVPPLTNNQPVAALASAPRRHADVVEGTIGRVNARAMIADLPLDPDTAGGPVFTLAGTFVGLTSFITAREGDPDEESRVVRVDAICEAVAAAGKQMAAAPPPAEPLPLEPDAVVPESTLEEIARRRAGSLGPYQVQAAGFDIGFLTPVVTYAALRTTDFSNWQSYVAGRPSVLFVRVTPKQEEGFWVTVARGMARLQGVALPPIKRFRSGFARLGVRCGDAEVTPIHRFLLERRISETDAIYEGLYVFDPGALGPHCGTVTLEAFSDKTPDIPDSATVAGAVLQQIWDDFAPYRALK